MIGILGGTGDFGQGLAERFRRLGEEVVLARAPRATSSSPTRSARSRRRRLPQRAAGGVRVECARQLASQLAGKIVVSVASPVVFRDGLRRRSRASSRSPSSRRGPRPAPASSPASTRSARSRSPARTSPLDEDVLLCGDDEEAKEVVAELAERLVEGRVVDCGRLEVARWLEPLTAVLLNVNRRYRYERRRPGHRAPVTRVPARPRGQAARPGRPRDDRARCSSGDFFWLDLHEPGGGVRTPARGLPVPSAGDRGLRAFRPAAEGRGVRGLRLPRLLRRRSAPDEDRLVEVHCFYSERFLVTVRRDDAPACEALRERYAASPASRAADRAPLPAPRRARGQLLPRARGCRRPLDALEERSSAGRGRAAPGGVRHARPPRRPAAGGRRPSAISSAQLAGGISRCPGDDEAGATSATSTTT